MKTTKRLVVALAIAMALALATGAQASHLNDTVLGTSDEETQAWLPNQGEVHDLEDLGYDDPFVVTQGLTQNLGYAFHVDTPTTLEGAPDNFAVAIDANADGVADFQVVYHDHEEDPWSYQESTECGWEIGLDLPAGFTAQQSEDDRFEVTFPAELLLDGGPDYRYFVQFVDGNNPGAGDQVYMRAPFTAENPWQDPETGCWNSSERYGEATFGLWAPGNL